MTTPTRALYYRIASNPSREFVMCFATRLCSIIVLTAIASTAMGQGMLVPTDRGITPLAMVKHHVRVAITDQVAVTTIEQTFRNHKSTTRSNLSFSRTARG